MYSLRQRLLLEANNLDTVIQTPDFEIPETLAGEGIAQDLGTPEKLGLFTNNRTKQIASQCVAVTFNEFTELIDTVLGKTKAIRGNNKKYMVDEWAKYDALIYPSYKTNDFLDPKSLFVRGEPAGYTIPLFIVDLYIYALGKGILEEVNISSANVQKFFQEQTSKIAATMLMCSKELAAENEVYAKAFSAKVIQHQRYNCIFFGVVGNFNRGIINANSKYLR